MNDSIKEAIHHQHDKLIAVFNNMNEEWLWIDNGELADAVSSVGSCVADHLLYQYGNKGVIPEIPKADLNLWGGDAKLTEDDIEAWHKIFNSIDSSGSALVDIDKIGPNDLIMIQNIQQYAMVLYVANCNQQAMVLLTDEFFGIMYVADTNSVLGDELPKGLCEILRDLSSHDCVQDTVMSWCDIIYRHAKIDVV